MDFGFSQEQEMLRDAARRALADHCPTAFVRKMMTDPTAHDLGFWTRLVELGWPGLLVPESYGGQGGSFLDMTIIMEEAGRALLPGPFFTAALLGAPLLAEGGSQAHKRELLPRMARGEFIVTLALAEAAGRFDPGGVQLAASRSGDAYTLSGEKFFVPDAHVADAIVVAARTSAEAGAGAAKGITALLVPAAASGVAVTQLKTADMTRRLCHVKFDGVRTPASNLLGAEGEGWTLVGRALEIAAAALAAELVGVAQRALDLSVEYAKSRVQFGRPIGSFQAVKHKCVDMMIAVENARSLTYYACWTVDERSVEAGRAVAMAKAYAGEMAKKVTSEAIQVHGGIGFTWEHDLHLFHRRALADEANFGGAPAHRETVARALLD